METKMIKTTTQGRREFLTRSALALCALRGWSASAGAQDEASVHGMLLVGRETAFLSHLPIFGAPHDYQVILEAAFTKTGSDPQADYFNDRKRSNAKVYTLEPDRFVLPTLAAAPPLRSFTGNIYRGHFERFPTQRAKDAARIAQHVDVTVNRVVLFRKFEPNATKPPQLEYLLFGKGTERFLAHVITRPPDFDQVLTVTSIDRTFTDDELARGVPLRFPGTANAPASRIAGTQPLSVQVATPGGTAPATVKLQPGIELYFEQGELDS
jgi:hypothetical protein